MNLIPKPDKCIQKSGFYKIKNPFRIKRPESKFEASYFIKKLYLFKGVRVIFTDKNPDLIFTKDDKIHNDEGYFLRIDNNGLEIKAAKEQGFFYGLITLLQIIFQYYPDLPFCEIEDFPVFKWRGMHLDVSRHFFDVSFVKRYLDAMALYKFNVFHWHLTDDNGWRIEIKKYPELTSVSAYRKNLEHIPWREREKKDYKAKGIYGGFYNQEEIKEIVNYARKRHIKILPEIEMPGHSREVFAAYPQFSCKRKKLTVAPGGYWPNTDIFCAGNDETFVFLENILKEVSSLFPFEYIHIGGDEVNKSNWETCPECQKRIKNENLKNVDELQSWFIKKIEKILKKYGKKLVGWDEITEGGLNETATVMCWRGDGKKAAMLSLSKGNNVILCPNTVLYFDWRQSYEKGEQGDFGVTTIKKVYHFNPVFPEIPYEKVNKILGAQGNVWTEFMNSEKEVEYMVFPRLLALSEVLWTNPKLKNWNDFKNRLLNHFYILDLLQINYKKRIPEKL